MGASALSMVIMILQIIFVFANADLLVILANIVKRYKGNSLLIIQSPGGDLNKVFVCISLGDVGQQSLLISIEKIKLPNVIKQNLFTVNYPGDGTLTCDCSHKDSDAKIESDSSLFIDKIISGVTNKDGNRNVNTECEPCNQTATLAVGITALCLFTLTIFIVAVTIVVNKKRKKMKLKKKMTTVLRK